MADARVQLAGVADLLVADEHPRAPARVPGHPLGSLDADLDAELGGHARGRPRRRPTSRRRGPAPHQPDGLALAAEDAGQEQRLHGQRVEQLAQLGLGRPPVHAVHRRGSAVDRERDRAGLEQGDPGRTAAEVARGGVEDAGQQRGRVERLLRRQRVGQAYGVAQHVVVGQAEGVEGVVADEREADHLDAARREPASGRSGGGAAARG